MASLVRDQVGRFSKKKPKQIKWRFLKYHTTKRKRIEIGRMIIYLSFFFAERFDNGCCKCGQKFKLKISLRRQILDYAVPSILFAQTAPLILF